MQSTENNGIILHQIIQYISGHLQKIVIDNYLNMIYDEA